MRRTCATSCRPACAGARARHNCFVLCHWPIYDGAIGIRRMDLKPLAAMTTVADIAAFLDRFAPPALAEDWDNVGLLVGRGQQTVSRIMTCLTITPSSSAEAISGGANLIVSHHPLLFRPVKRLTGDSPEGNMLLDLIVAGVAVFSPHTAFDSAAAGINQRLAEGLGLAEISPLVASDQGDLGAGRQGVLDPTVSLAELADRLKRFLHIDRVQIVGSPERRIARAAIACGSAGEFLQPARAAGCEVLVTGEVRFHTALEAEALDTCLLLAGHFASERFALERLAEVLAAEFPQVQVWASKEEKDPLLWL
jgi:dinuclear metal center YbgI/SA1388 family protein